MGGMGGRHKNIKYHDTSSTWCSRYKYGTCVHHLSDPRLLISSKRHVYIYISHKYLLYIHN